MQGFAPASACWKEIAEDDTLELCDDTPNGTMFKG
jgi:hypothetical protein